MNDLLFYFETGFLHVLDWSAIDHLLFFCALTIVYTFKDIKTVFWVVTFFTFGHTLSLILSTSNIVNPPPKLIEFLIPSTIILTALHNIIFYKKNQNSFFEYIFSIFFGLIHGFGFGNYFDMLTDSLDLKAIPLIGFAVGVEMSQLIIVFVILIINTISIQINLLIESKISHLFQAKLVSVIIILLSLNLIYEMI